MSSVMPALMSLSWYPTSLTAMTDVKVDDYWPWHAAEDPQFLIKSSFEAAIGKELRGLMLDGEWLNRASKVLIEPTGRWQVK